MQSLSRKNEIFVTDQEFEILVSTSGKFAAGTDAKVFIKLFGSGGESDEIELIDNTKGKRLFEAGRCVICVLLLVIALFSCWPKLSVDCGNILCIEGVYSIYLLRLCPRPP